MTNYEFGEVLLLNAYPYSNLTGAKKRPTVVLSDTGDEDVIVARVTSHEARDDYDLFLERWKELGLLLPSVIRMNKIAVLSKSLILKRLGKLGSPERRKARVLLKKIFEL